MRALSLMLILAATPVRAEEALIAITFGSDTITIAPGEVRGIEERADKPASSLLVTLDEAVAPRLSALTGAHVGEEGAIRVCGAVVSRPVLRGAITGASFVISDGDPAEIQRLARVLSARDCAPGA